MLMEKVIKVGMADLAITKSPGVLITIGLGSCIGVVLYDPQSKVGGLVHIMLPDSSKALKNENRAKFADTGIILLYEKVISAGANKNRLISKIAGGAQMFNLSSFNNNLKIGERNVEACRGILKKLGIPIKAEDVGGTYGRTIEFYTENGILVIKTVGAGTKTI